MPSKVALYVRVSTQEQAQEGYSIAAQTERLTAYCKAKDWPIYDTYTDAGFSGSNMERPELSRLIRDVRDHRCDCVLVYKLDRLSRSQKDTLTLIEDIFLKHDVAFVSMSENFDTSSPLGRAMIGILSVFSQLEREQIRERMEMGRDERARSGLWHGGGWRPYGYQYINGQLIVDEAEAVIVRDVFRLFAVEHTPIVTITRFINKKYGKRYGESTIRSMLTMPLYTGVISWKGKTWPGKHQAIISRETFDAAQKWMRSFDRVQSYRQDPFRASHMLTGLLFCGNCGARYTVKGNYSGRGAARAYRPYYYCLSRSKMSKHRIIDGSCLNPSYACVTLDAYISSVVRKIAGSDKLFQKAKKDARKAKSGGQNRNKSDRVALLRRIDVIDGQLSRIVDLYQLGSISIDEVGIRSQKLQAERDALRRTVDELDSKQAKQEILPESEAKDALLRFAALDDSASDDEKRELLTTLIDRIVVLPEKGQFDIVWKF